MSSRLLSRLDADIKVAPTAFAADCLRCERAAYLARHGDFDEATQQLEALRKHYSTRPSSAISAWLHLAEGLLCHYKDLSPHARDKLNRAHALSAAAGLKPLQALSAAWLAHLDYLRMDIDSMARRVAEALSLAVADHHAARARAELVVAQAYHEAGRFDLARPWYDSARRHATADGDDATLSAMMWNMASLRVAAWRQIEACEPAAVGVDARALLSAESTAHFDDMLGVKSLRALQPILRAQVCTLLGRTDEALALYTQHLADALAEGMRPVEGVLLADRAWCHARAGNLDAARADGLAAASALSLPGSFCDRAPGHSRLAQVFEALSDVATARTQRELASAAWGGHRLDQARLVDALGSALAARPG